MTGFNPKMLGEITKKISGAQGGSGILLDGKRDLKRDVPVTIRLVKPHKSQWSGGDAGEWNYVVQVVEYWIDKKHYYSPATFGDPCPIAEEVANARADGSSSLVTLLEDWKGFSEKTFFYMPIVPIEIQADEDTGEVSKVIVTGPQRILKAPPTMADDIHKVVMNPKTILGSKGAGIFHRELGYSITLLKSGEKKDTKYTARLDPTRVPLTEEDYKPADIMGFVKKRLKSNSYLRAAIRAYLYGEPEPEDLEGDDESGLDEDTMDTAPKIPSTEKAPEQPLDDDADALLGSLEDDLENYDDLNDL